MCGIFAYLGSNPELLKMCIDGLQRLEYRGYDSAGVCLGPSNDSAQFLCEKSAGKVSVLRDQTKGIKTDGVLAAIAHTRWATHGKPTNANAHPHLSPSRNIAVVHNGIIENYQKLKSELQAKGYIFESATDSEVLAVLVEDVRKECGDWDLCTVISAALGT